LVKSSKSDLVEALNKAHKSFRFDLACFLLGIFFSLVLFYNKYPLISILVFSFAIIGSFFLYKWEKKRLTVNLEYDLNDIEQAKFKKILDAINILASCNKLWILTSRAMTDQWKHHGGATELIKRETVKVGEGTPEWVNTNVSVAVIDCRKQSFYFLPDGILVYDSSGVGHIDYSELLIGFYTGRYIETESVPSDARIIEYTWEHPNKKGGPDRRFASNKEIPVCAYGYLNMETKQGVSLALQTSREDSPEDFEKQFLKRV